MRIGQSRARSKKLPTYALPPRFWQFVDAASKESATDAALGHDLETGQRQHHKVEGRIPDADVVHVDDRSEAAGLLQQVAGMEVPVHHVATTQLARVQRSADLFDPIDDPACPAVEAAKRLVQAVAVPTVDQDLDHVLSPAIGVARHGET